MEKGKVIAAGSRTVPPASLQAVTRQEQHAKPPGTERRLGSEPTEREDEEGEGEIRGKTLAQSPSPSQDQDRMIQKPSNYADEERFTGMDMIDRANSGKPVLSGPADLGLEETDARQQTGERESSQSMKSGQEKQPQTKPDGTITFGTSIYDPDDETDMVWEHGRRYCRDYFMPNDEDEQDRLRILNQIYLNIFNLELTTIDLEDPTMVLDVGTGTGEWAMGMAERWPDCKVIGIDISPTFERAIPLNCHFEVMDGEDPWPWVDNSFDMVHYRHMSGAFRDWSVVYSETLRCLKPGGWVEILEFHDNGGEKNFYDRFPPDSLMHKGSQAIERAEVMHGKHRGVDHMEPGLLESNGFVDCEVHEHVIPLDPSNSPLGKLWLVTLRAGFESYSLRLLTKYVGWDASLVRMGCERVGQQMIAMATNPDLNKGFQMRLRVTIARKPLEPKSNPAPSQPACAVPAEEHVQDIASTSSPPPTLDVQGDDDDDAVQARAPV